MRRVREILRLKHECGATDRVIARSLGFTKMAGNWRTHLALPASGSRLGKHLVFSYRPNSEDLKRGIRALAKSVVDHKVAP